jgi:hypothetical protein
MLAAGNGECSCCDVFPLGTGLQFEGGEPCSICGQVIADAALRGHESVMPTTVIPGFLYLGSYDTASRQELLKAMNITDILNVRSNAARALDRSNLLRPGCMLTHAVPACRRCLAAKPCTRTRSVITRWPTLRLSLRSAFLSWVSPLAMLARLMAARVGPHACAALTHMMLPTRLRRRQSQRQERARIGVLHERLEQVTTF